MRRIVPALIVRTVVITLTIIDTITPGAVVSRWGSVAAQQPPPPTVFRAATDLVEVDVVVHGRNGAFVSDLSFDDSAIEDAGEPQRIQQFYLHMGDAPSGLPFTAAPRQLSEPPP